MNYKDVLINCLLEIAEENWPFFSEDNSSEYPDKMNERIREQLCGFSIIELENFLLDDNNSWIFTELDKLEE